MKFLVPLLTLAALPHLVAAQAAPPRPDSARVVVLPDAIISDKITRLVVATGNLKRNASHGIMPGGGFAVLFGAPRRGYHMLSSIRVHLDAPGSIREGQLRVRVASMAPGGGPDPGDLLPTPLVLTTETLQHARKNLLLSWPDSRILVPEGGFFLVVEGLSNQPDEYVSGVRSPTTSREIPRYELSRRDQPTAPLRVVAFRDLPVLLGAVPAATGAEGWHKDAATQQWRRDRDYAGRSVVFLEAVFE